MSSSCKNAQLLSSSVASQLQCTCQAWLASITSAERDTLHHRICPSVMSGLKAEVELAEWPRAHSQFLVVPPQEDISMLTR